MKTKKLLILFLFIFISCKKETYQASYQGLINIKINKELSTIDWAKIKYAMLIEPKDKLNSFNIYSNLNQIPGTLIATFSSGQNIGAIDSNSSITLKVLDKSNFNKIEYKDMVLFLADLTLDKNGVATDIGNFVKFFSIKGKLLLIEDLTNTAYLKTK